MLILYILLTFLLQLLAFWWRTKKMYWRHVCNIWGKLLKLTLVGCWGGGGDDILYGNFMFFRSFVEHIYKYANLPFFRTFKIMPVFDIIGCVREFVRISFGGGLVWWKTSRGRPSLGSGWPGHMQGFLRAWGLPSLTRTRTVAYAPVHVFFNF